MTLKLLWNAPSSCRGVHAFSDQLFFSIGTVLPEIALGQDVFSWGGPDMDTIVVVAVVAFAFLGGSFLLGGILVGRRR